MQPTSSSQNIAGFPECQFVPSNTDEPEDNQHPSIAFARVVTTAQHTSPSTVIREQPADDADTTPPGTGLVARTITEIRALSVRSEPMSQSSIMAITAGRYNPLALEAVMRIRNSVIEELEFPALRVDIHISPISGYHNWPLINLLPSLPGKEEITVSGH